MDSLTQLTLGAAVGVAVMGRRTAVWKAALWGGLCGTLPDLDSFIDYGDPISNMTRHRAESHALFYLTLLAPLIALLAAKLHGEMDRYRRWWLALWLALVTHPLLDLMTVYGTQIALPFTDHPFGVGSIFIIDPLYTLPLVIGVAAALVLRSHRGWRWNIFGLVISTVYLAWTAAAQNHVESIALQSLQAQQIRADSLLVTPAPFNTLLWRIVAVDDEHYREGFYSLLDRERRIAFDSFSRGAELYRQTRDNPRVERLAWFSHGLFKMSERDGEVRMADLRMGLEPYYTFTFVVGVQKNPAIAPVQPRLVGLRPDLDTTLPWLWQRMWGNTVEPPPRKRR